MFTTIVTPRPNNKPGIGYSPCYFDGLGVKSLNISFLHSSHMPQIILADFGSLQNYPRHRAWSIAGHWCLTTRIRKEKSPSACQCGMTVRSFFASWYLEKKGFFLVCASECWPATSVELLAQYCNALNPCKCLLLHTDTLNQIHMTHPLKCKAWYMEYLGLTVQTLLLRQFHSLVVTPSAHF